MQNKVKAKKPFILILYGYPGSGKSTFARQFAQEIENTVHIYSDKINAELAQLFKGKPRDDSSSDLVVTYLAKQFLESGSNVILDMPVTKKSDRRKALALAREANAKLVMVWLQIDTEGSYDRLKKRDKRRTNDKYSRNYTRSEFDSIISSSQNPNDEDYVVISGKHTFKTQKTAVFNKLEKTGVVSYIQTVQKKIKPELVNLIPPSFRGKDDLRRRDISIR